MTRRWFLLVVALLIVCPAAQAAVGSFDGYTPQHKHFALQTRVFQIVHQYWTISDLFIALAAAQTPENEQKYLQAIEIYQKQSIDLGKEILVNLEDKNRETIQVVSEIYKSLEPTARQTLYASLGYLRTAILQEFKGPLTEEQFREYFPGYGYTEPGYKYRKGREIERENKGFMWQTEEQSITTTWNVEMTINIDLLDILKGLVTGGAIKDLKVGEKFETTVNGEPMICVKVSFVRVKAITTKTNRKFEVNKVWFELLRAQVSGWSTGPWETCGKTYEILHEPTGEEVVTGISAK